MSTNFYILEDFKLTLFAKSLIKFKIKTKSFKELSA